MNTKLTILIFHFILLVSCQQKITGSSSSIQNIEDSLQYSQDYISIDTIQAKDWLTKSILEYFNGSNSDMATITTSEYNEFKMDAMNVDIGLDNSLSKEEFQSKWKDQFDLKFHPIQDGFLISAQDWGKISIPHIKIKSIYNNRKITLSVIIRDDEYETEYDRDIILTFNNNKFLISDVLEYD